MQTSKTADSKTAASADAAQPQKVIIPSELHTVRMTLASLREYIRNMEGLVKQIIGGHGATIRETLTSELDSMARLVQLANFNMENFDIKVADGKYLPTTKMNKPDLVQLVDDSTSIPSAAFVIGPAERLEDYTNVLQVPIVRYNPDQSRQIESAPACLDHIGAADRKFTAKTADEPDHSGPKIVSTPAKIPVSATAQPSNPTTVVGDVGQVKVRPQLKAIVPKQRKPRAADPDDLVYDEDGNLVEEPDDQEPEISDNEALEEPEQVERQPRLIPLRKHDWGVAKIKLPATLSADPEKVKTAKPVVFLPVTPGPAHTAPPGVSGMFRTDLLSRKRLEELTGIVVPPVVKPFPK